MRPLPALLRVLFAATLAVVTVLSSSLTSPVSSQDAPPEGTVESTPFEQRESTPPANISFVGVASSANARWLVAIYDQTFLRPADNAGLDHWLSRVVAGGDRSRLAVVRSFLNSEEGSRGEATRAYAEILGRSPDPAGLAYWTDYLRDHPVTTLRFLHLASDEYYSVAGGSDRDFVISLYQQLLFRAPDEAGLEYQIGLLERGVPRWDVVKGIYVSPESLSNRVTAYFQEILGRVPSAAEVSIGTGLIVADDERAVRAWLLASDEAFDPFVAEALSN